MKQSTLVLLILTSICGFLIILASCSKNDDTTNSIDETSYESNEKGKYQDFLTPNYYNADNTSLRNEINKYVYFARNVDYNHPFQKPGGQINTTYSIGKDFGFVTNGVQYHPALDMHPNNSTNIILYAAHDGIVHTYRDNPKYRHHLTITKDIYDDDDNLLGKLVSIYAHIDLDEDESNHLFMDGTKVKKGDIISENLYSETVGGPHLHLEIRFYRNDESSNDEFYHWQQNSTYTAPSAGIWTYGYWNLNIGYGYGNPQNMGIN